MKPYGLRICLAPSLLVHLVRPPCFHKILLSSLPSPFAAFFLRPAQIACFGLEVQETQKTAQQEKTGKMREEKQDTLPIIFILLCSLLGSASRVQVAVRLRCELAYEGYQEAEGRRMSHSRWWGGSNCGWQVVSAI